MKPISQNHVPADELNDKGALENFRREAAQILRPKMNCTVGFVNCFLRVAAGDKAGTQLEIPEYSSQNSLRSTSASDIVTN